MHQPTYYINLALFKKKPALEIVFLLLQFRINLKGMKPPFSIPLQFTK